MRVVLLNQYYAPDDAATAQLLADLGEGLAAAGHDVDAICSHRAYADPSRTYPSRETLNGVRVRRTRCTGFGRGSMIGRILDYVTFLFGAGMALAFQPRPDVVVSLSTPPMVALLGLGLARLRRARSLYWVMDVYPDVAVELGALKRGSLGDRLVGGISRTALRGSDEVVALGETMAEKLRDAGARRISVIHNWADGETIQPRPLAGHPLREAWGWDGRFVVLYSGNMGMAHEFETVLDAAEQLRDRPEILFAFIGGGPRRAEVEAEVERRKLTSFEFRPYVDRDRLGESLTAGDVHLVTLRDRMPGLLVPSKIYGILAAGRPTLYVGPDEGEIATIVAEGDCGRRVPLGQAEALARTIRSYADDPVGIEREGAAARRSFEERFTRGRSLARFLRLIDPAAA